MDKMKQYVAGAVVISLAILLLGYNFLVGPKRSAAADLRAQIDTQSSTNAQLRTKLSVLKSQAKDLPKEQAKLAQVAAKIPDNPALPALIRALTAAGVSAGVELISVTPGPPAAAVAAATPVAPAAAPVAGEVAAPTGAATLAAIPVALNVVGGYFQVEQFLASLERLGRAMRVTNVVLAPGSNPVSKVPSGAVTSASADGRTLVSTITGQVYMAAGAVVTPATPVVPTGPAPVGAAAPTATK